MTVRITRTVGNPDGTVTFYTDSPAHHTAHVVGTWAQVDSGEIYAMLELAAKKVDDAAAALAQQTTLDSQRD